MSKSRIRFALIALLAAAGPLQQAHAGPWKKHLDPITGEGGSRPWLRTLIHMHSLQSHDACDKKPIKDGVPNERCLEDFRRGLCQEHVDLVFITEHRDTLTSISLAETIPVRDDDRLLLEAGTVVGTEHTCPDGHKLTMYIGAENQMMSLGLTRHPDVLPGKDLEQTYNDLSPEAAQNFREAGAIVAMSHAEEEKKSVEQMRAIKPELIEAYNLHANLMQDVYPKRKYGQALKTLLKALSFMSNPLSQSDLIFHSFFKENDKALTKWGQLATDMEVTGIAGTDSHQNAINLKMWDGERVDSYRRTIRWFSNWVRLPVSPTRTQALEALKHGKSMIVIETLGDPVGFDFTATSSKGEHAMGDRIEWQNVAEGGLDLHVKLPRSNPSSVRARILKATGSGWVTVAESADANLDFKVTEPGAYRSELWMKPKHLKRHLIGNWHLIKPMPWVYSNPIYVR